MPLEVEQKYRCGDVAGVETTLRELGATPGEPVRQVDTYYAHPHRDFAATDEALRLRQAGEENSWTYKGPKLDLTTKTRVEEEVRLADGAAAAATADAILRALGFQPVRQVVKRRRPWRLRFDEVAWEAALDEVEGLGTFVEIESHRPPQTDVQQALSTLSPKLTRLAAALGLGDAVRESYLELLLAAHTE